MFQKSVGLCLAIGTAMLLMVVPLSRAASDNCTVPPYVRGQFWVETADQVSVAVAISARDLNRSNLMCLAKRLRSDYAATKSIFLATIFTDRSAAKRYPGPVPTEYSPEYSRLTEHIHALYYFSRPEGKDTLTIRPIPGSGDRTGPFDMELPLDSVTLPACRYEVNGRCWVMAGRIQYPQSVWQRGESGDIALTATIGRSGELTAVAVVDRRGTPTSLMQLADEAKANLKTWRFETSPREDKLRITYHYTIDASVPRLEPPTVTLNLPTDVTIRARPVH